MLNHCILNRLPLLASNSLPFVVSARSNTTSPPKNYRGSNPVASEWPLLKHGCMHTDAWRFCGFKCSQAHYQAVLIQAQTFHNLNLLPDPPLLLTTADIVLCCYVIMLG